MGGDEFCVLAPLAVGNPLALLERGQRALGELGDGFEISAAHGCVLVPEEADDAATALGLADRRMYAEKATARRSADEQSRDVLLKALEERHPDLGDHVHDVGLLAEAVAEELGLDGQQLHHVRQAAELHDIGKVAVPSAILDKPGQLDADEWAFIARHTLIGERILGAAIALRPVAKLVRSSHERWDGSGYPDGLAGDGHPARRAHRHRLRRVRRDDLGPPLPARARPRGGARGAAPLRRHAVRPGRRRRVLPGQPARDRGRGRVAPRGAAPRRGRGGWAASCSRWLTTGTSRATPVSARTSATPGSSGSIIARRPPA